MHVVVPKRTIAGVIHWTQPAKPKPKKRFVNRAMVMAEKAVEKAAIKTYMGRAGEYDVMNREMADYFLSNRREYGESSIQVQYSLAVFARLGIQIEEDIAA